MPFTFIWTESSVGQMPSTPCSLLKCSDNTAATALSKGGSHFDCCPLGMPFKKNTTSASVMPAIAVPLPTDPPFTTWATFRNDFSVTTSTMSLRVCTTLELKERPEIVLCSSKYSWQSDASETRASDGSLSTGALGWTTLTSSRCCRCARG